MAIWSYKTIPLSHEVHQRNIQRKGNSDDPVTLDDVLNEYGGQGWELVAVVDNQKELGPSDYVAVMKRPSEP